jgi:orotidine-5'-phosphate decarboxylase
VKLLGDWLESNSRNSGSKIILAADVGGPFGGRLEKATDILSAVGGRIVAVKVNWHLLLPFGVLGLRELVKQCSDIGLPLIADMKLNDIGSTNVEAAETLFSNGFDALIANPFVGYEEGIGDLLKKSKEMQKAVILLVYMSHPGAKEGYGLKVGGEPLYLGFANKARKWGADGAVVSSKSPKIIREVRSILREDQVIMSPGVGAQGGDARKALAAGSDYVIVGRSIVGSKDPEGTVEALNRELEPKGA